jgi:hypothetical protein
MPAASTTVGARNSPAAPSCAPHADRAAVLDHDAGDLGVLDDLHAALPGALGVGLVVSTGLVCPSLGVHSPPTTPLPSSSG